MNTKQLQLKAIPNGKKLGWMVIEFYVHPTMGECHTGYTNVIAMTADEAIEHVSGVAA